MSPIKKYIGNLFLTTRFYLALGFCIVLFVVSFFYTPLLQVPKILVAVFTMLVLIDYLFLFIISKDPDAKRLVADRLSNGDENKIEFIDQSIFSLSIIFEQYKKKLQKGDQIKKNL